MNNKYSNTPLVSIITVVKNRKNTILRSLESVKNQTHPNIEHIIIDGQSTDGTIEIIKTFKGKFKLIIERDQGIYDALNKGIKLANGTLIGIMNSDDLYFDVNTVSEAVKTFNIYNCDGVYGDVYYFRTKTPDKFVRVIRSVDYGFKYIVKGLMPAHTSFFFKKSVFDKYGYYDISYKIAGDFEFIARITKDNNINLIYSKFIKIKMQIGGISTSGIENFIIKNLEIRKACQKNNLKTNWFNLGLRFFFKIYEYIKK